MKSDLNQALRLVGSAQENIDKNEFPHLWKLLGEAFDSIDDQMEVENQLQLDR
jgi:hypothetical protein